MKNSKALKKYLQRNNYLKHHLEPVDALQGGRIKFKNCIVIAACDEYEYLPRLFKSLNKVKEIKNCAVIVVVNNSQCASQEVVNNNLLTLKDIKKSIGKYFHSNLIYGKNLFIVDAVNNLLITHKRKFFGVGAARKLGMDLALNILNLSDLSNEQNPLMISLDADCLVDEDYLLKIEECFAKQKNIVAGVCRFRHQRSENELQNLAIAEYEQFMDNYVNGLKFAGSPYAFYALGSAIVCTAEAYVAVNGMVIREAGEDFYFLQKLRKYGGFATIPTTVYPSSRISERVPFGTGTKIAEILNDSIKNTVDAENRVVLAHYNNKVFWELKKIYDIVEDLRQQKNLENLALVINQQHVSSFIKDFFIEQNFCEIWQKILNNVSNETIAQEQAFHIWFDGFKILKFIHFLEQYPQFFRI